jgi:hypothetical protein
MDLVGASLNFVFFRHLFRLRRYEPVTSRIEARNFTITPHFSIWNDSEGSDVARLLN